MKHGLIVATAWVVGVIVITLAVGGLIGLDLADSICDPVLGIMGTAGNYVSESSLGSIRAIKVSFCKGATDPKDDHLVYEVDCSFRTFVFQGPPMGSNPMAPRTSDQAVDELKQAVKTWRDALVQANDPTLAPRAALVVSDGDVSKRANLWSKNGILSLNLETYHDSGSLKGQGRYVGVAFTLPIVLPSQMDHLPGDLVATIPIGTPAAKRHIHINQNVYRGP